METAETRQQRLFVALERIRESRGQGAEFVGVLEPPRLLVEAHILAGAQLRVAHFACHVPEPVGASLRLGGPAAQVGHRSARLGEVGGRCGHGRHFGPRFRKGVEDRALRRLVEQRLRGVLPMHAHQRRAEFGQDCRGHGRAVDPRAGPTRRSDLALEHEHAVLGLESTRVEERAQPGVRTDLEVALDDGLVRASAHGVS